MKPTSRTAVKKPASRSKPASRAKVAVKSVVKKATTKKTVTKKPAAKKTTKKGTAKKATKSKAAKSKAAKSKAAKSKAAKSKPTKKGGYVEVDSSHLELDFDNGINLTDIVKQHIETCQTTLGLLNQIMQHTLSKETTTEPTQEANPVDDVEYKQEEHEPTI